MEAHMSIFGKSKPDIEKLAVKGDVSGLIEALHYKKDPQVQIEAANALSGMGESAVEPLIIALKKGQEIQAVSASILEKTGSSKAAEALQAYYKVSSLINQVLQLEHAVLTGSSIDRWFSAVDELGQIWDARAIEPLSRLLKHTAGGSRVRLAGTLEKIDEKNASYYSKIVVDEVEKAIQDIRLK
jgi:HEAT repeat protein